MNDSHHAHMPTHSTLAAARERFLTAQSVDTDHVRDMILASWWRSRRWNVAADKIDLPYVLDPNLETKLSNSASPVLAKLYEQLADSSVSIILTDSEGVVLDRRTSDKGLRRHLDRVQLAPGFTYAEQYVGTNGIGTALEGLQAAGVSGHEHYAENLERLGCAGVPIRHPISHKVLGVLDLTCWSEDASPLLMALARSTADRIERELTTQSGLRELALFEEYMRACHRGTGIVFALNNDVVMMNDYARQVLSPDDQAVMLGEAAEAMRGSKHANIVVDLPSGSQARLFCAPVHTDAGPAGGVVSVKMTVQDKEVPAQRSAAGRHLPGVIGSGGLWVQACAQVTEHRQNRESVLIEGEPGTGKLTLAHAVHNRYRDEAPIHVIDGARPCSAAELAERVRAEFRSGAGTLVFQHVDRLGVDAQRAVADELAQRRHDGADAPWLVATATPLDAADQLEGLLWHFRRSVEIPPLRHHVEDVRELVPYLLVKLSSTGALTCSNAAMQLLLRANWPGNVTQLENVLRAVARHRRAGAIEATDLPPEFRTVRRRVLKPLEAVERDEIVRALVGTRGNKAEAAQALGMSRATIYRKIRDFGIDLPS